MYNLDRRDLSSTSDQSMAGIPVVGHDAGWVPLNGRSLAAIFAIVPYLRRAGSTTAELCVKLWSDPEQVERQEYHAMDDDILISVGLGSKRRVQAPKDRVPPGQYVTTDFPVLSAGPTPQIKFEDWTFALQRVRRLRFMENDDPGLWERLSCLIDSFVEQLSQVFMLRFFMLVPIVDGDFGCANGFGDGQFRTSWLGEMMAKPVRNERL
jgi:hypothetical protein